MCIGVPSKVIALGDGTAVVESLKETREVSLLLLEETINVGDYLLIQVGNFAVEKIPQDDALAAIATLKELEGYVNWGKEEY